MEFAIPFGEFVLVVDGVLGMGEHHLHVVEIPPRRVQHREPRGERLDRKPRLDELERAHLIDEVARAPRAGCRRADKSAAAETSRHEPCLFELIQRAAHRAPRCLERCRQLPLGREPVAFAIGAGLDGALQIGRDGAHAAARPGKTDHDGFRVSLALLGQRPCLLFRRARFGPACRNWFTIGPWLCANGPTRGSHTNVAQFVYQVHSEGPSGDQGGRSGRRRRTVPKSTKYAIIGAGIHGLSTAFHLAQRLKATGRGSGADILVVDKTAVAAGASGIACGVVRNNYFQPAMRELMAQSVEVWESDPKTYAYHPVGYMQISPECMHEDVASIYEQQKA